MYGYLILTQFWNLGTLLAWGPLGRLKVLWSKSSSVRASIRASVRPYDVTNLVPRQNLRTVIGIDLLFFLIGWYNWGVVQWQKKSWKRCEKRCEIVKKVWNTKKKNLLKIDWKWYLHDKKWVFEFLYFSMKIAHFKT